ncbi:hypothetical protein MKW94_030548 [Papaver nudicaule]|uniref:Cyclin N-terminal domain-containing protein n=1 Tax=Papaver nudicaule TaxID=74823 RepID=A0AA41V4H2_PAPNU|nr:hypothetical protein [Papaver nudicaule]
MMINKAEEYQNTRRTHHRYIGDLVSKALGPRKVVATKRHKPKEPIIDIDKEDVNNILAGVEYVEDLYKVYKLAESSSQVGDYMDQQKEIDVDMRLGLVDWLIGIQHNKLKLPSEVLFLTMHIVDKYLELNLVAQEDFVLLGLSAMLIAGKYEEDKPPGVQEYVTIACGLYTRKQILGMEKSILGKLGWTLTVPTTYHFLVRFIKTAVADKEMEDTAFFMAELGLMQYATIKYSPSLLAASAVYAAKLYLKITPFWNETLEFHTGFSESQVTECAQKLLSFHSEAVENLQAAYKKYMSYVLTL